MVVAATGDDKVNLVVSLLAKTEYGVPRTVARVNNPKNEWMFDEAWGVDVAVSTPRLMTALVEEAVSVGDLVRIFTFQQVQRRPRRADPARRLARRRPRGSATCAWPPDTALVAIIREGRPIAPSPDDPLEAGDELLFVATPTWAAARGAARPARPLRRSTASAGRTPARLDARGPGAAAGSSSARSGSGVRPRASSQAIVASAATCSGQPSAILVDAEPADLAGRGRAGTCTTTRTTHGTARIQVSRLQSRTTAGSRRQDVRSPVTDADHQPDQRPADQDRQRQPDGVHRVVDDARAGRRPRPCRCGTRRQRGDRDADQAVDDELHRLALHEPDARAARRARPMPTYRPRLQVVGEQVA